MMSVDPKKELDEIKIRILFIALVESPGIILIGLGLFGKFAKNAEGLHAIFANANLTTTMLVVGGVITVWCNTELIKAIRRRAELAKQINT